MKKNNKFDFPINFVKENLIYIIRAYMQDLNLMDLNIVLVIIVKKLGY